MMEGELNSLVKLYHLLTAKEKSVNLKINTCRLKSKANELPYSITTNTDNLVNPKESEGPENLRH